MRFANSVVGSAFRGMTRADPILQQPLAPRFAPTLASHNFLLSVRLMNASDADRPESTDNVPEPPVPSEPGDASQTESDPPTDGTHDDGADPVRVTSETTDATGKSTDATGNEPESSASEGDVEVAIAARVPDPIRPAEGQSVGEPSVTFEWEQVEQADNYQLQIAKNRDFTDLIFDARVGSSSAFTYSGLPPQEGFTLYWRVRAHSKEERTWTDFGTVGTFVLADWRPEQPALANAQDASTPGTDADMGDSSRAEPVLITFSLIVTVVAVGLSIIYMQDGGFFTAGEETEVVETADADTVSLDLKQPVANEDGETFRISIDDAMRQVVRERGGTWEESPSETADEGIPSPNATPQDATPQDATPQDATSQGEPEQQETP